MQPRKGPRIDQVWKKKPDIWLKVNKGLEELTHINDNPLLTSGVPTSFLSRCVSLPCLTKQTASLCVLPLVLLLLLSRFSRVQLCVTPYTAAHQAPLSLGFSRQEHRRSLVINVVPAFTVYASVINAFRDPGKNSF